MSPEHETPPVPSGHPNPVMVGPGMESLEDGAYAKASYATQNPEGDQQQSLRDRNEPSYFASGAGVGAGGGGGAPFGGDDNQPITPEDAAMFSKSGKDLLRRLSLVGGTTPQELPQMDPREQYPGLRLSGRIISAAFCIPYKLYFRTGSDWVCSTPPTARAPLRASCMMKWRANGGRN